MQSVMSSRIYRQCTEPYKVCTHIRTRCRITIMRRIFVSSFPFVRTYISTFVRISNMGRDKMKSDSARNDILLSPYRQNIFDSLGLAELGPQLVKLYIIPRVKPLVLRMDSMLEKPCTSNADRVAVTQIKSLLIVRSSLLFSLRIPSYSENGSRNDCIP